MWEGDWHIATYESGYRPKHVFMRVAEGDNRHKGRLRPFVTFSSADINSCEEEIHLEKISYQPDFYSLSIFKCR